MFKNCKKYFINNSKKMSQQDCQYILDNDDKFKFCELEEVEKFSDFFIIDAIKNSNKLSFLLIDYVDPVTLFRLVNSLRTKNKGKFGKFRNF